MKLQRILIWTAFIICIMVMQLQVAKLKRASDHHYGIIAFEFAKKGTIANILTEWHSGGVLNIARDDTVLDFLFIVSYVLIVIMLSYRQMQRERWSVLNNLLRLNFLLIIIAGLLDVAEDIILLRNIHLCCSTQQYTSAYWFALIKFTLAGIAVLIWLISVSKSIVSKSKAMA